MTVQRILDAKGKGATHITPNATIAEVLQSLESQNVDALVGSDDGSRVDGIISEHKPVRELMTAKVICCTPGDRIENLAAVMVSKHVRHLPVVVNNKLVGIVSIRDLIRLNMQAVQSDADAMRCYIQEH